VRIGIRNGIVGGLELVNSMPCMSCVRMMQRFGIKRVYYTNDDGEVVSQKVSVMRSEHITAGFRHFLLS
jgi:deoxycytidylate deaminase